MDCPQCRSPNPDEAACCSLCFAFFKEKPVSSGPKPLVAHRVSARLGEWVFTGPMVADPEALYFFVEKAQRELTPLMKLWAVALGQSAGLVGGVLVDHALEAAFKRGGRPTALRFGAPADILAIYALCPMGLDARPCSEYFAIPRADVRAVEVPAGDQFLVSGAGFTLAVEGPVGGERLSGCLRMWGYPVVVGGQSPLLRKGLRLVAPMAVAASVAAFLSEAYEFHWLATLPEVQKWLTGPDGRLSVPAQYLGVGLGMVLVMFLCFQASRSD